MRTIQAAGPQSLQLDNDQSIPAELAERLYRAGESRAVDLVAGFSATQRANLAVYCYHKAHLHRIGLAIAATCDRSVLELTWGRTLGKALFERVNDYLASCGLKVTGGTIVDATIIAAPSSTKNQAKARDPEMHQTRKGQQWYFGMKLHIGVDSKLKLIHSLLTSAANVHDGTVLGELLHGEETRVYGDQAYRGRQAVIRAHAPQEGLHQPALSLSWCCG